MTTTLEYALLAGDAYFSTRADINRFPIPEGWTEDTDERRADVQTGFEARTFQKGSEIVISFAGTDPNNSGLLTSPDGKTNTALASGKWAEQLYQAAKYYLDVKAANPGATITLTGHSLGGGLAALVAVFFDVYAQTFDQAPFSASALNGINGDNASILKQRLKALTTTDANGQSIRTYNDTAIAALTDYVRLRNASTVSGYIPRQERVDTLRVQGEFLDGGLVGNQPFGNPQTSIPHGPADWTGASFDLHSQALLTAFLQSEKTALPTSTPDHTLSEASKNLKPLLQMLFDTKLFAYNAGDKENPKPNFLDLIVRHEAGVRPSDNAGDAIKADAMVTRFTSDLWKLAQGGLTQNDGNPNGPTLAQLSQTLIAFAMQFYYEGNANAVNRDKTLFSDVTGGIRLDLADVSKDIAAAMAASERVDLNTAKGFDLYFKNYLQQGTFTDAERQLILAVLPAMRDWYVQAGSNGLATTDDLNWGAFMLGGVGSDALAGGNRSDLLVGNAGDDVLMGGQGNDTYVFQSGDGLDTLLDSDGQGSIVILGGADGDIRPCRIATKSIAACANSTRARDRFDLQFRPAPCRRPFSAIRAPHTTTHQGVHHA